MDKAQKILIILLGFIIGCLVPRDIYTPKPEPCNTNYVGIDFQGIMVSMLKPISERTDNYYLTNCTLTKQGLRINILCGTNVTVLK